MLMPARHVDTPTVSSSCGMRPRAWRSNLALARDPAGVRLTGAAFSEASGMSSVHATPDAAKSRLPCLANDWRSCARSVVTRSFGWAREQRAPALGHSSRNCFCASSAVAVIFTRPVGFESAPYLTAFVQSSLRTIASGNTAPGLTSIFVLCTINRPPP